MLLDKYMEDFDFNEIHQIEIGAHPAEIYSLLKKIDFTRSRIIKTLFNLRRLPKEMSNLEGFIKVGFMLLEEKETEEIVIAFLGNKDGLHQITHTEFQNFTKEGHVLGAWNLFLTELDEKKTLLSTETRVFCTDNKAKFLFSLYWFFIAPFSAWIRRIMLRSIKEEVE
ncbi:MAG: hypothetical protein HN390_10505 [Anaerolineae bacterium]|jgi:hypothetical protein|nr:hypothetical protein [Anaerolineae bacterium]MBT7189639.1 hypothetical protein [Anaerolineae bacterium]MBT7991833.1 hypothetical protein [Anaerolineae bacterium]